MNPIPIAVVANHDQPVTEVKSLDWETLGKGLAEVAVGQKDGRAWLPVVIEPGPRTAARVQAVTALVLDVEADTVKDKETGIKRVTGPEPPDPEAMAAEIGLTGWACHLHTSHSHLDPAIEPTDQAHPRYRLVFPLSRHLTGAEVKPLGLHIASLLGIGDCLDTGCLEPARLFYLPRCPAERQPLFQHIEVAGTALEVDNLLAVAKRASDALSKAKRQRQPARTGNVIDAFNQGHDIGAILETHGYIVKGRNRWMHPTSTTGLPGVRRLPDSTPERVFSSHGADPLNDGHAHDAFDCFRILKHGGDMTAAVKEAARILGLSGERGSPAGDFSGGGGGEYQAAMDEAVEMEKSAPEPLRAALPPAEPYPVDALGDILGNAAQALHESVKAPLAMCCQSVLAAASLACQAHYDVKLPWGDRKPLSLFLLTVGESGERKSGIDDLVLGAAKKREQVEMNAYQADFERYETDLAAWNKAAEAARAAVTGGKKGSATVAEVRAAVEKVGEKPTPPIAPTRFITDPTVEGLFKLLVIAQPSVALFSDEGGLLIGGHALNSDNALKTMARWCKLWDGAHFDRVRAGDGAAILYGRRMAMHQLAQPDVMTTLLSDRMANGQGLLARCLVAWPESTIGTRFVDGYEWAGNRPELKRLFAVLSGLMEAQPRTAVNPQELDPVELPLSPEATDLAVKAGNEFERLMGRGGDLAELKDRTSKALENACRIAGILAVIGSGLSVRQIEVDHLGRALVLMQWYLAEALRIRGAAAVPQSVLDAEMLLAWLQERCLRVFRTSPVLTGGPNPLRNKPRLTSAIAELMTCGYITENPPGTEVDGVKARKSWRVLHYVV